MWGLWQQSIKITTEECSSSALVAQTWKQLQTATVAQFSTQQEQLLWKWGRAAYASDLHYQTVSTHVALRDLREKERFGREQTKLLSLHLGNQTKFLPGIEFY